MVGSGADCFFCRFSTICCDLVDIVVLAELSCITVLLHIQASVCYSVPWFGRPQLLVGASNNCIFYIFFSNALALNGNNVTRDTTPFYYYHF